MLKIVIFIQKICQIIEEISKIFYLTILKIPNRAAQNKQRGRMRPAGRQFDMPDLNLRNLVHYFIIL